MSQEVQTGLRARTQQLMDGPLKHIRGAALAAALVPLASLVAAPASAQTQCSGACSGTTSGIIFNDTNGDGIYDSGDNPYAGVTVTCMRCNGTDDVSVTTDQYGFFQFPPDLALPPTFSLAVLIPTGTQPLLPGLDNVGTSNGFGFSVATGVILGSSSENFGFVTTPPQPGTGTPGYWKNHPEAWPVSSITVGGIVYPKAQAISFLSSTGKDKTVTMFQSLVSAKLNVMIGNENCIYGAIAAGDAWLATYGPVGTNVAGGSAAWTVGDPIHNTLDAYDNGLLCAPHRQ